MNLGHGMPAMLAIGIACVAPAKAQTRVSTQRVTEVVISADARYESNIARRSPAQAALLGLVPEDGVFTPKVGFRLARPVGNNLFSLNTSLGYVFHSRNTRLDREQLSADASADVGIGRCQLVLNPAFSRGQSDLAQIAGALLPAGVTIRNTQTIQDYQGQLLCGNRNGWRPVADVQRSIGDNSNPLRRVSDYRTFSYGGGLSYANPVIGTYSATYRRVDTSYPSRPPVAGGNGFVIDRATLSGERSIGSVLRAGGSISFLALNPDQAGVANFNSVGWTLSATALPGPDLQIKFETGRDIKPSLGNDSLYRVSRDYSLRAAYAISSRTLLSLAGQIGDVDYVGAGTTFGPALTRSVQRSVSGDVTQDLSGRLKLTLKAGYQQRTANDVIYNYNSFFAGAGLGIRI